MNAIVFSALWGVLMMFAGVFLKNKEMARPMAIGGALIGLIVSVLELQSGNPLFAYDALHHLKTNNFNLTFIIIVYAALLLFFLLSGKDIEKVGKHIPEYFALLFFIMCGVCISATFNTLLMLFLGIEIMSIPLYILTGSDKRNLKSNEAALKYLLLGSFSTGILLLGITFIYGGNANGSFYIDRIQIGMGKLSVMMAIGIVLLMIALSFKVSAAPFHFWAPDVYDGAPTVFTSFMLSIIKVSGFVAFLRLFDTSFNNVQQQWQNLVALIILATLVIGNITAVFQQSVKRMMAYSSIAQAGFMLFAIFALGQPAKEGLILYAAAYCLASIGFFAILLKMKDYTIDGFNGLGKEQPVLGFVATVCLLSLTGIPLTAGFSAKFYMLLAAVNSGKFLWLVIVAVLMAAVSAYYYFRVIQAIYFKPAPGEPIVENEEITTGFKFWLIVTVALIILFGAYPEALLGWLYF